MTQRHNVGSIGSRAGAVLRSRAPWALSLALGVASCSGSDSLGPVPGGLVLEAGSATAVAGDVGDPVIPVPRVIVRRGDEPAAGVAVTFSVSTGGGRVLQTSVNTDASGGASPGEWVLGTVSGAQTLTVTSASVPGRSVVFTATAAPAEPSALAFTVPPSLSAADRAIAPAVQVAITDQYGNRAGTSATITVALASGPGGALTGTRSVGAVGGLATFADLRVSAAGSGYRLVASSPGLAAATSDPFDIVAGGAAVMAAFQGNGQTAVAGSTVAVPPAVKLLDAGGNPVAGAAVTFAAANGGSVSGGSASTDADGVARAGAWRLGTVAGPQTLSASATAVSAGAANFSATATAGAPSAGRSSVEALASPVPAGTESTIRATVRDQYDNPVSGATVTLAASGSNNSVVQPPATGADGRADGRVSSTKAEAKVVSASVNGVSLTQTASMTVTPGPVATVAIAQAPQVSVNVNATVQLTATVQDQFANSIATPSIAWSSGSATVATVSSAGLVTGKAPTSTTITATVSTKVGSALLAVYGTASLFGRTYCTPNGTAVKLDLFLPDASFPRPRPAAVWIHGGAWISGTSRDGDTTGTLAELKQKLLSRGYVVASLNYRLGKTNPLRNQWPAQGQDVRCAVRYLRHNDFDFGIDVGKVYVVGGSAGGHLAAFLGTGAPAGFPDTPEHLGESSDVQAVAAMAGVYSLLRPSQVPAVPVNDRVFVGWPNDSTSEYIRGASPITRASPGDPPFLAFHGELDGDVLPIQAQEMDAALDASGVWSSLVIVPEADHRFLHVNPGTPTNPRLLETSPGSAPVILTMIADFLDSVAGGATAVASFRRTVPEGGVKIPAHSPHPRAVKGRFLEPY